MIDTLLDALVRANVAGGSAIVAVLMIRAPMRRRFGAGAAYALWLAPVLIAAASLAPPLATPALPVDFASLPAVAAFDASMTAAAPTVDLLRPALAATWLGGAFVTALLFGLRQAAFVAEVRRGRAGPALVGVLRPRIVTPSGFEATFSADERALILAHEATHLARGDAIANALAAAVQCACWFNPLIHMAARRLRMDQELACDEAVLGARPEARKTYAETLLKTQIDGARAPFVCAWPSAAAHPLKERIAMLKSPLPSPRRRALGLSAAASMSLMGAVGAWAAQADTPRSPTPAPMRLAVTAQPSAAPSPATPQAAPKPVVISIPKGKIARISITDPTPRKAQPADQPQPMFGTVDPSNAEVVIDPVWMEKPTGSDVAKAIPPVMQERFVNVQGSAKMTCNVARDGLLTSCNVFAIDLSGDAFTTKAGDPPDLGMREAMLQLSKKFRMAPKSQSGFDTAGKTVVIPIRFGVTPPPAPAG